MKAALCFNNHSGVNNTFHAPLWEKAIRAIGWEHASLEVADVAIMWGPQPEYFICKKLGKPAVILDFPYWNRSWKARGVNEYYKVSLNGQHPTPYVMREAHTPERYLATGGPEIKPWKTGGHILLCGIGNKAAAQYGYHDKEWERRVIEIVRQHTDRPIVYRPKPNNGGNQRLSGALYDNGEQTIGVALQSAHVVITHHGNPGVDGLAAGVPVYMNGTIGVASHLARLDLHQINDPYYPENRLQFFSNLAHWQWSVSEILEGKPLLSMKERGLL